MRNPAEVEAILLKGATKARVICTPFMQSLRQAVGLRSLGGMNASTKTDKKAAKTALASFKQYRESDGLFYFKLVDAQALFCCKAEVLLRQKKRAKSFCA